MSLLAAKVKKDSAPRVKPIFQGEEGGEEEEEENTAGNLKEIVGLLGHVCKEGKSQNTEREWRETHQWTNLWQVAITHVYTEDRSPPSPYTSSLHAQLNMRTLESRPIP